MSTAATDDGPRLPRVLGPGREDYGERVCVRHRCEPWVHQGEVVGRTPSVWERNGGRTPGSGGVEGVVLGGLTRSSSVVSSYSGLPSPWTPIVLGLLDRGGTGSTSTRRGPLLRPPRGAGDGRVRRRPERHASTLERQGRPDESERPVYDTRSALPSLRPVPGGPRRTLWSVATRGEGACGSGESPVVSHRPLVRTKKRDH